MNRWTRRLLQGLSLLALGSVGCAEERDPINRVQADALAKSFFVADIQDQNDNPVFYWRNFVVDGTEAQSMVGIGSWGGVDKIRFEITEHMLFARKAYPISDHADDKGYNTTNGTLVAAYPIVNHFDIKRDYNPQTGEELNVINENSSDRPWYQREYFRVDWSTNMVESPMWSDMFSGKLFGDVKVTPIAYYVNDRSHADAPHFSPKEGYFDVTNKFFVEPEQMESPFSDLKGQIPACLLIGFYTGTAVNNCDPQEAVVRSSYWRADMVPSAADFEPFENTKAHLDIVGNPGGLGDAFSVGIVTPPRVDWDPQYGYTDEHMKRFMHVHNIWVQSHQLRGNCSTDAECNGGACLPVPDEMGKPTSAKSCTVPCNYKARGDGDGNGTDQQCENGTTGYAGNQGSQCSARNWCTLPYRDRKVKTMAYWMNRETPAELTDTLDGAGNPVVRGATEDLSYSWNQLMKHSVAKAREVECRRTGGNRADCFNTYFEQGQTEMVSFGGWGLQRIKPLEDEVLVSCHNPVRAYDHKVCGDRGGSCKTDSDCGSDEACGPTGLCGYSARVGDLRHNFTYYWPYASRAPWGGIANWNADPTTGMIIGAAATTMGRSATYAAAMVRDIIMVANGELKFEDITSGTPATLYERRLQNGYQPSQALSPEEIQSRIDSIDAKHAAQMIAPKDLPGATIKEKMGQLTKMIPKTVAGLGPASPSALQYEAIAEKVRGTEFEAQLVDSNWLVDAAGMGPNTTVKDVMEYVSPLRGMDEGRMGGLRQLIDLKMQSRGICFPDIYAGNVGNLDVQGVAKYFAAKFNNDQIKNQFPEYGSADPAMLSKKRAELIYNQLWKETFKGIALHEVGHSLGMLHQFASSFDSANFLPQYWQLRTQGGKATKSCDGKARTGDTWAAGKDSCMGPRYLDPETDEEMGQGGESRPGIAYFGHTSTMEYQNERFFETVGLGSYDLHTMGLLYGRVLQTFDSTHPQNDQNDWSYRNWTQLAEQNLINWANPETASVVGPKALQSMHYTEQARRFKVFDPGMCRPASPEEKAHAEWRVVGNQVCSFPQKDYGAWIDFEDGLPEDHPTWMNPSEDSMFKWRVKPTSGSAGGAVRWPYRWGVGSNSYVHTNPSDAGADIYEVVQETIRKFKYGYPFSYFRRQNRDWYYRTLPSRVASNFYERLRAFHWSMANTNARFNTYGPAVFATIANSDDWWRPYVLAETDMFNHIALALMQPQIGEYRQMLKDVSGTKAMFDPEGSDKFPPMFELDASTARFVDPDFDSTSKGGGSWAYQDWVNHTGFVVEKSEAARALTDGRAVFSTISRENYLDGRNVNINFRTDMPEQIDRLLGGLLSGDFETIAPYVLSSDTDDPDADGLPNPEVHAFNLGGATPTRPSGAQIVFPNVGYKQTLGTLVFAHIFARLNGDLGLANKLRMWVDGLSGEIKLPDAQQARFTNPESGYTYIGRKYGPQTVDGKTVDKGIASRMIARANLLLLLSYETSGTDAFGSPILVTDANGQPVIKTNAADSDIKALRDWVGTMDATVQIGNLVGYGPFYGLGSVDWE